MVVPGIDEGGMVYRSVVVDVGRASVDGSGTCMPAYSMEEQYM